MRDISYCMYEDCPIIGCERHKVGLDYFKGPKIYTAADFHEICVAFNTYKEIGILEAIAAAERGKVGEWTPEAMKWREQYENN